MPDYSKKHLTALESTVYAYEKSISDLENGVPPEPVARRWKNYGGACRLCDTVPMTKGRQDCRSCILGTGADDPIPCIDGWDARPTFEDLEEAIWGYLSSYPEPMSPERRKTLLLLALKQRLAFILSKVDESGYEVK